MNEHATTNAGQQTGTEHPSKLTTDQILDLAHEVSELPDEDWTRIWAILERGKAPHPEWCVTDLVGSDEQLYAHRGESYTTVRKTDDEPRLSLRLYSSADAMEPLGYGSTSVEMTVDPGIESSEGPLTVLLEADTVLPVVIVVLQELRSQGQQP
jgi:hypothetical protein